MVGKRISVNWKEGDVHGWHNGTVTENIDPDDLNVWEVEYDSISNESGGHDFPEQLFGSDAEEWTTLEDSDDDGVTQLESNTTGTKNLQEATTTTNQQKANKKASKISV